MKKLHLVLISIAISFYGMSLDASAQSNNPLRSTANSPSPVQATASPGLHPQSNELLESAKAGMSPEAFQAAFPGQSASRIPVQRDPTPSPMPHETIRVDANVNPANYVAESKSDLTPLGNLLESLNRPAIAPSTPPGQRIPPVQSTPKASLSDVIERLNSTSDSMETPVGDPAESHPGETSPEDEVASPGTIAKFDQEKFQGLLKQLATNTCLVMGIGVGFILVAKRFVSGKKPAPRKDGLTIEIKSTLKLSPKSSLHLVQAGEQRLIVANDQNGIKTVVPLTESFASTLDSITEIATDLEPDPKPEPKPKPKPEPENQRYSRSHAQLVRCTFGDGTEKQGKTAGEPDDSRPA